MADVDFRCAPLAALHAGAKLVALGGRIHGIEKFPQGIANDVLGNLRPILRPVGFHHAGFRQFQLDEETQFMPEIFHHRPNLLRFALYHQPALRARAFHPHAALFQ